MWTMLRHDFLRLGALVYQVFIPVPMFSTPCCECVLPCRFLRYRFGTANDAFFLVQRLLLCIRCTGAAGPPGSTPRCGLSDSRYTGTCGNPNTYYSLKHPLFVWNIVSLVKIYTKFILMNFFQKFFYSLKQSVNKMSNVSATRWFVFGLYSKLFWVWDNG